MRWYSPRDWIEEEDEEGEGGGDCPPPPPVPADSAIIPAATSSLPQHTSSQSKEMERTKERRDEGSVQDTSNVTIGDTEMETGEAATEGGDDGDVGDGWDNEGWGEEDWDMINDDGEEKSRQKDSPSQDNSMTPAIKVKKNVHTHIQCTCYIYITLQYLHHLTLPYITFITLHYLTYLHHLTLPSLPYITLLYHC